MPQTVTNIFSNPAQPGQRLYDDNHPATIVTGVAAVTIPPGVLCEFITSGANKGLVQPVQDTGTAGTFLPALIGVSLLDVVAVEQAYATFPVPPSTAGSTFAGYPAGFVVPFVRAGFIWAAWDGNTGVALPLVGNIQVWHSSTGANPQGVFTTKAAQTTVGAEIDAAGAYIQVYDPNSKSGAYTDGFGNVVDIVALDVNLPGHN